MRAAVLGSPIAHSLSPVLHRAAYAELGLDWQYDAFEVTAPELSGFIANCGDDWAGLSLTMPLKETVLPLLDTVSDLAVVTRSANTVVFTAHGREGHNTDVGGICWALTEGGVLHLEGLSAAIIGAGATARSALAALAQLGAREVSAVARRAEALDEMVKLGERLEVKVDRVPWEHADQVLLSDLVVSTVPKGVVDHLAVDVPDRPGALLDVVYAPWPTDIAKAWADNGGAVVSGLEMLVGQAAEQVRLMTGEDAPVELMLAVGQKSLQH